MKYLEDKEGLYNRCKISLSYNFNDNTVINDSNNNKAKSVEPTYKNNNKLPVLQVYSEDFKNKNAYANEITSTS